MVGTYLMSLICRGWMTMSAHLVAPSKSRAKGMGYRAISGQACRCARRRRQS
jgi:hypothetical protein